MSRASKKRALEDSVAVIEAEGPQQGGIAFSRTTTHTFSPSTATSTSCKLPPFVLQSQLESLKVELDHERSLRALDQRRALAAKERLEKMLEIASDEAKEATRSLTDAQEQSEKVIQQLRESRNQAVQELRRFQIQQLESSTPAGSDQDDSDNEVPHSQSRRDVASMSNSYKDKCLRLEKLLESQRGREEELMQKLASLRNDFKSYKKEQQEHQERQQQGGAAGTPSSEEAPPTILKELNRVRISLAESERRERQWTRKAEDLQRHNQSLVQSVEAARMAQERLPIVQAQLKELQSQHAMLTAQHEAWNEFGQTLQQTALDVTVAGDSSESPSQQKPKGRGGGPPEVASIQRYFQESKARVAELESSKRTLQEQVKQLRQDTLTLETQIKTLSEQEQVAQREKRLAERQSETSQRQVQKMETTVSIHKREVENLQSLVKTLDELPLGSSTSSKKTAGGPSTADAAAAASHSAQALQLSLDSVRDQLQAATDDKNQVQKESDETHQELERVKEKFGKLRDALQAERNKAQQAEQRANEAEALAGKGSFNPETTRVLHLQETPLAQALKEEIQVLQRQLKQQQQAAAAAAKSGGEQQAASAASMGDPAKLNKRLKENFQQQIALFREGVYLMTGYKVDMLPGTDRPTFRVRSVYAEQEEDHFMLKWPKGSSTAVAAAGGADQASSLDILSTPLAKTLTTTPSYDYMTKFHSLPAFMASVQLSLFEKQTVMIS